MISVGYYSTGGASDCTICPAGAFCQGDNADHPQLCSPGFYQETPGASQTCPGCPLGTYNNMWVLDTPKYSRADGSDSNGATDCCPCCPGTYGEQIGQTHCFSCQERQYPHSPLSLATLLTSISQIQTTPFGHIPRPAPPTTASAVRLTSATTTTTPSARIPLLLQ